MSASYLVAASDVEHEIIINKSRFICYLFPCADRQAFKVRLSEIQSQHPTANHHCYAFVTSHPNDSQAYGFSDDGEPSGTAGRPMLATVQGSNIGEIAAIVVRYFGGVKLGTGGLQRAYSAAIREALPSLATQMKVAMVNKSLTCQYAQVNDIQHLLEQVQGRVIEQDYGENVELLLSLPEAELKRFSEQLTTLSAGQIELVNVDN